jgi:hypothetical protein
VSRAEASSFRPGHDCCALQRLGGMEYRMRRGASSRVESRSFQAAARFDAIPTLQTHSLPAPHRSKAAAETPTHQAACSPGGSR